MGRNWVDTRSPEEKERDGHNALRRKYLRDALERAPESPCDNGRGAFEFWLTEAMPTKDLNILLYLIEGHGVEIVSPDLGQGCCGTYYDDSRTLIHGAGGYGVARPTLIRHNAWACAEGIYQAGR